MGRKFCSCNVDSKGKEKTIGSEFLARSDFFFAKREGGVNVAAAQGKLAEQLCHQSFGKPAMRCTKGKKENKDFSSNYYF